MNNLAAYLGPFLVASGITTYLTEQNANILTFAVLGILWLTLFTLSIKRTLRWEPVSIALTTALFMQALREGATILIITQLYMVPLWALWVIRVLLVGSALTAVFTSINDKPVPAEFLRRRWTDKYTDEHGVFDNNRLWVENGESLRHTSKAIEEIALILESLSLGPVDRTEYTNAANKIRRHVNRAQRMLQAPVDPNIPPELLGVKEIKASFPEQK